MKKKEPGGLRALFFVCMGVGIAVGDAGKGDWRALHVSAPEY